MKLLTEEKDMVGKTIKEVFRSESYGDMVFVFTDDTVAVVNTGYETFQLTSEPKLSQKDWTKIGFLTTDYGRTLDKFCREAADAIRDVKEKDVENALKELVRLKDIKETDPEQHDRLKESAWQAAREALENSLENLAQKMT